MRDPRRERTLLRLIEQQQKTINDLCDRLMHVSGNTWMPPPPTTVQPVEEDEELFFSALHDLPPD